MPPQKRPEHRLPGNIRIERQSAAVWLSPLDNGDLLRALAAMKAAVDATNGAAVAEVHLHLVDDACIRQANRRFLDCNGPTNVLSFPGGKDLPGILMLSLDTLARECLLYGQDATEHCLRLLAHGMGHLAGMDHGEAMDALCETCVDAARKALAAADQCAGRNVTNPLCDGRHVGARNGAPLTAAACCRSGGTSP